MNSLICPNCDAPVPLQGGDDEWCAACGKRLPLAVVAAVHAAAKRMRLETAAAAGSADDKPKADVTPPQDERPTFGKRVAGCANYLLGFWRS